MESVGVGFFETIGLAIRRGRTLTDLDRGHPRVVVNETMALQSWPDSDPIGQTVDVGQARYEVVGVVKDLNGSNGLMDRPVPTAFRLMNGDDFVHPDVYGVTLIVRGTPGTDAMTVVRGMIASTDPDLTMFNTGTVEQEMDDLAAVNQEALALYGGIGLFGLILSAVGLSGVTAYTVIQRTKEVGIRMALGATRFQVLRLVTHESVMLIALGSVIGLGAAYGLTRMMNSWFSAFATMTRTTVSDPILLIGAPLLLAVLTLVSCYLPARRSMKISPSITLREE
jgi:ABC-type antimicrobial peptide transport system permease subunit